MRDEMRTWIIFATLLGVTVVALLGTCARVFFECSLFSTSKSSFAT